MRCGLAISVGRQSPEPAGDRAVARICRRVGGADTSSQVIKSPDRDVFAATGQRTYEVYRPLIPESGLRSLSHPQRSRSAPADPAAAQRAGT